MATRRNILVTALVCLCALLVATAVEGVVEKTMVTRRPFSIYGDATVLIDWSSPWYDDDGQLYVPWTMTGSRVCTEGWFTNEGEGVIYLDTGIAKGSGLCREANGDLVEWESAEEFGTQHVDVSITNGCGQFKGLTGNFSYDYTVINSEMDANGNPTKLVYSYWGKGVMISR